MAKGDTLGNAFAERQPQVRAAFDPLERAWRAEVDDVLARAAHARTQHGREAGAEVSAAFTRRCADEALATAEGLIERFSRQTRPVAHAARRSRSTATAR